MQLGREEAVRAELVEGGTGFWNAQLRFLGLSINNRFPLRPARFTVKKQDAPGI